MLGASHKSKKREAIPSPSMKVQLLVRKLLVVIVQKTAKPPWETPHMKGVEMPVVPLRVVNF